MQSRGLSCISVASECSEAVCARLQAEECNHLQPHSSPQRQHCSGGDLDGGDTKPFLGAEACTYSVFPPPWQCAVLRRHCKLCVKRLKPPWLCI